MSHFAKIEDGIVVNILVCDNDDPNGDEGYQWLIDNFGGTWIKASYNTYAGEHLLGGTPLRKNYPGIGYSYDEQLDAFIPPKPYNSWILDKDTCQWKPPIDSPNDGIQYEWVEESGQWLPINHN